MADGETNNVLTLTTEIVSSFVGGQTHMNAEDVPALIRAVRAALTEDMSAPATEEPATVKATKGQINKSITPDGLVSFIDGKMYKTLKRHLGRHGHDVNSYKAAYGLPSDYPSVAPNYSAARSAMAKNFGLGASGRGSKAAAKTTSAKANRKKAPAKANA